MTKRANPMAVRKALTYDTEELARALGVTPTTIRNMVKRGMPVMASQKPHLFSGEEVRTFIRAENARKKQPLVIDELYCPSCRKGQNPLDMRAELVPLTEKTSLLRGGCVECGCPSNRMISNMRLSEFAAIFDIKERAGRGA